MDSIQITKECANDFWGPPPCSMSDRHFSEAGWGGGIECPRKQKGPIAISRESTDLPSIKPSASFFLPPTGQSVPMINWLKLIYASEIPFSYSHTPRAPHPVIPRLGQDHIGYPDVHSFSFPHPAPHDYWRVNSITHSSHSLVWGPHSPFFSCWKATAHYSWIGNSWLSVSIFWTPHLHHPP